MAVPHVQLSIQGTLPGGEVWSVNPNFAGSFTGDGVPTHAQLVTWAQNAGQALNGMDAGNYLWTALSSAAAITKVRASLYGADGRLSDYADYSLTSAAAGSGTLIHPTTTAMALSLYTGIPGRRYRGRLFWPALGVPVESSTGRISAQNTSAAVSGASAMLAAIEAAAPAAWDAFLCVWSGVLGAGAAVDQLRVGNVLDSQRGRKDALVEVYANAAFPPAG